MTRHYLIVNPVAGRGAADKAVPAIEDHLRRHGQQFDLVRTERPWHAAELAREAVRQGYDVVVAVGGDGTANEVLNGLMSAKEEGVGTAAMGMISVGRGNDFAYGAGVPQGAEAGCEILAKGHRRLMDVGRVTGGLYPQGRYFGNGVGIGFDAVVGFEALKMKRLSGAPSYLVAALKTIFLYYTAPTVRVEYEGRDETLSPLMISIMNGRRMGGMFQMAPQSLNDDGLFDLCVAGQTSKMRILGLIPYFVKGTQATQPEIQTARTSRLVVTALKGALPAHGDGETLCTEGQQLTLELLPLQIEVLCQPGEEAA